MGRSRRRSGATLLMIPLLLRLTAAVSLVDFVPRTDDLPDKCQEVYTKTIGGCTDTDFKKMGQANAQCSQPCVQGLVSIQSEVQKACAGLKLTNESIIARFLKGDIIPSLCPNFRLTTVLPPPQSTAAPEVPLPSAPPPTTIELLPPSSAAPSDAPSSTDQTSSASPSSTDGGNDDGSPIATDSNPPPLPSTTVIDASAAPPQSTQPAGSTKPADNPQIGGSVLELGVSGGATSLNNIPALASFTVSLLLGAILLLEPI